jgi:GNAT superfamily N-acetyltransferase
VSASGSSGRLPPLLPAESGVKVSVGDVPATGTARVRELLVGNEVSAAAWSALAALGVRCVVLYERPLSVPRMRKVVDPAIEFGRLRLEEADAYAAFRPDGSAAQVRERFSAGDVCCVARSGGELVAARWFSTRRAAIPFLEHSFALGEGEGYLYNAFTAPAWRGHGVAGALTAYMLDELEREGVERALSAARPQNVAGTRFNRSAGRPVAVLATIRVGPWRRHVRFAI